MKHLLTLWVALTVVLPAAAQDKESDRLGNAAIVISEIMGTPESSVPGDLLNQAVCVGIVPSQKKIALGIGGSYGRGALVCRRGGNGDWGAPSMFTIGGANIGFQIGGQATDIVFIVMNPRGALKLLQSKTKLGADASVAGGPVGRTASGATDLQLHAEILSYSRSRGLFAGVSLEGAMFKQDHSSNQKLYGQKLDPKEILFTSKVPVPPAAKALVGMLQKYSPKGGSKMDMKD